jgi:superfamily II DNA or RNA helicase
MPDLDYVQFLATKGIVDPETGIEPPKNLNTMLYDFQRDLVIWALRRGRAAMFCDCGMGKTPMQLEWARCVPGRVLILAPLAVAKQTIREGEKFGIECHYARSQKQAAKYKIVVTNYEMLEHFNASEFNAIVLDESSILKAYDGKTRTVIINTFKEVPFRLACTATPAPNDYMELGNHAEFLGVMKRQEMLSMFFVHDGGETQKWRLKGHAENEFWKWLCSWAVMLRKPSDLHYEDGGFILPPLEYHHHIIESESKDFLFPLEAQTLQERIRARADSVGDRARRCAELVNKTADQFLVWCGLNKESDAIKKLIPDSIDVRGSDTIEHKEKALLGFASGDIRVLITKPSIAGFGMNFQNCSNMVFLGLSDSWEQWYQAVRRCWRFGQSRPVDVHVITAQIEGATVKNIQRKEEDAGRMVENMVVHMADLNERAVRGSAKRMTAKYKECVKKGKGWTMHLGDSVEICKSINPDSIHYSVFSPPFSSLYTYSNSSRDMGNCAGDEQFFKHFSYLIKELYRITMAGRLVSVHCMDLPTTKTHHGYIGLRDFRGEIIRAFESLGFIYHSVVVIWKDPVTAMQRTKALGLLHKQLKKNSAMSRQGIPDYVVTFRKPGENPEFISHTDESFPVSIWQKWASPIWTDINPSDTLQFRAAREHKDEKHIAPLQLEVIRRNIVLWSNPGDLVFSPFAGIGSEGYVALQLGRKFIGVELKESYYRQAVKNLSLARQEAGELFQGK